MTSRFAELAIDCAEPRALAQFWCAALGYDVLEAADDVVTIGLSTTGSDSGPVLTFAQVPEDKVVKNRLHIDLSPIDLDQDGEVQRLLALGAQRVDIGQGDVPWVVLGDPAGNEFCVLGAHPA